MPQHNPADSLESLAQEFHIHDSWLPALRPVAKELRALIAHLDELAQVTQEQAAQEQSTQEQGTPERATPSGSAQAVEPVLAYLPVRSEIFAALAQPFNKVRVLILGQDPYPNAGDAMGLSFSVSPGQPIPASLRNIYTELQEDLGIAPANHGDLRAWSKQGVLLLNRVLTVEPGQPKSHSRLGWQKITDAIITALASRDQPLVAILWGKDAQAVKPLLADATCVESAHPSPLAAYRGFFGSRPFSRVNEILEAQGEAPIHWELPPADAQPIVGQQRLL